MVRSHSKNNTSGSVFTYHERHRLDYGAQTQRIGSDSMKKIDACYLCLGRAQNAVACQKGHLYCKECILSSLVSQKSMIKSQQSLLSAHAELELQEKADARSAARARVLQDFERGLTLGKGGIGARRADTEPEGSNKEGEGKGTKRKFDFDEGMVEKLAKEAEDAAMRVIEAEQVEARKAKIPAFWLPTLTPEAAAGPLKDVKLQTLCSAGEHPHTMSMKQLIPVNFTYSTSTSSKTTSASANIPATTAATPICPSCSRELTNAVRAVLLTSTAKVPAGEGEPAAKKSKKDGKEKEKEVAVCGHVVCGSCVDTIVKPGKQCVVCEAKIRPEKDMLDLGREGTGYAAAGGAESTRQGLAFRV